MITLSYVGSAVVALVLAGLFVTQTGGVWTFIGVLTVAFFLASAGASAAYLTVSEIFPMETRALAIAFFYAVGTAIGGITGPLLFGQLINSGERGQVVWSFVVGAVVMAAAGLVELWLGVAAEGRPLEELALPLTAADAEREENSEGTAG
jgi:MFS family permease